MDKKCLISGGAGFIGSHFAEALLERGNEVYVIDDLSTGNLENIQHLIDLPNFHFVLGSVLDEKLVDKYVSKCDYVYHLAAAVGVKLVFEKPLYTITTNIRGTEIILQSALRYGRKVFISSTSEVYGKDIRPPQESFCETNDVTVGPSIRWCYAATKILDEFLARAYFRDRGLPVIIARYFNVVGPRQTGAYGMVIPRFIEWALKNQPILIYGDGNQIRCFTYITDAIEATIKLTDTDSATGETFNIGSEEQVIINDLAAKVKDLTNSKSEIRHISFEEAYGSDFEDIRYRFPDISKLKKYINFTPSYSLEQTLISTIEYTKKKLNIQ